MSDVERAQIMSEWLAAIVALALREPGTDARKIAQREIASVSAKELRALAVEEITARIERVRRADARRVEDEAAAVAARHAENQERWIECQREDAERLAQYQSWRENPAQLSWNMPGYPRGTERKRFVKWLHDDFEAWYRRVRAECREDIQADFHWDGIAGFYAEKRRKAVAIMIDEVVEATRLEVTEELLGTLFALGDGVRVTWGEATVEQHNQRLAMLTGNIEGLADTAARHRKAIEMIQAAGVGSLADLPSGNVSV